MKRSARDNMKKILFVLVLSVSMSSILLFAPGPAEAAPIQLNLTISNVVNLPGGTSTSFTLSWGRNLPQMTVYEHAPGSNTFIEVRRNYNMQSLTATGVGTWSYYVTRTDNGQTTYISQVVNITVPTLPMPVLSPVSRPMPSFTFPLNWSKSSGDYIYELAEDTNPGFTTVNPPQYWPRVNYENIPARQPGTYYYRVRAWDKLPEWGGIASAWSDAITVTVLSDADFKDLIARKTFDYFIASTYPSGLTLDRFSTTGTQSGVMSIASSGFYLSALTVGVERGWITRGEGYDRAKKTLQTIAVGTPRVHGFYYHFLKADGTPSDTPFREVSTIDTALLIAGALQAGEYFGGDIKALADYIYKRVEWDWMYDPNLGLMRQAWHEPDNFQGYYNVYSEAIVLYLLAIGSPTHAIPAESFYVFHRPKGGYGGPDFTFTPGGQVFTYQYAQAWFDFRNTADALGVNWWQNSIEGVRANQRFAIDNRGSGYSEYMWGITACDGPDGYNAYGARPAYGNYADGTIAPTGMGGSIVLAPDIALPGLKYIYATYGDKVWNTYGFIDAFNVERNWYDPDYIGIDQGIILLMFENGMSGLIWNTFMKNQHVLRSLSRAHFSGYTAPDIVLEDFEDGNFWTPDTTVGWWDSNGNTVYRRMNTYTVAFDGRVSMEVNYSKNGDPWSLTGAWFSAANPHRDFSFYDTLTLKVYNSANILVKLRDQAQTEKDAGTFKAKNTAAWNNLSFDIANTGVNKSAIDNILLFVDPGDEASSGNIYLDQIKLENRKSVTVEDFEDGNFWSPAASLGWWDGDGTMVYQRAGSKDPSHGGFAAMRVSYAKNGLPWSCFGGYIDNSNPLHDFTKHNRLAFWVFGTCDIMVKLRDRSFHEAELGKGRAANSYGWTRMVFDYTSVDSINLSDIDNILFFVAPGDASASGTICLDDIVLE
ncbi:MAG: glucoamylase family protein [Candidatus Omnitrophica bacterium]|nr:glucoamylase family protein [Candidatus Omnitrophota bacterium]